MFRPIRVCVCGGRDYNDINFVYFFLSKVLRPKLSREFVIIQGGARGADSFARHWAEYNHIPFENYPADWDRDGRKAGPIRNKLMLSKGIDILIAFKGGTGTAHMKRICQEADVKIIEPDRMRKSLIAKYGHG